MKHLAGVLPVFSTLPPDKEIGYAPAPGAKRVFSAPELERLASRNHLQLASEAGVCFERPLETLTVERLIIAMRSSLQDFKADIEIVEFSRYAVPRGEVEFPWAGLSLPLGARSTGAEAAAFWKGFVRYAGNRKYSIWARLRISIKTNRVVSVQNLRAGHPIDGSQLRLESYEGYPPRDRFAQVLEEAVGSVPRHNIAAGSPVLLSLLERVRQVAPGDAVRVEVRSGAARIELEGHAESGGSYGDTIRVRNVSSGKVFRARVEGSGRAVVLASRPEQTR